MGTESGHEPTLRSGEDRRSWGLWVVTNALSERGHQGPWGLLVAISGRLTHERLEDHGFFWWS